MIEVREITSDQANLHKQLVLRGLMEDEDCFRISPQDEEKQNFPTTGQPDSFTLGAFDKNRLVGVASFKRDGRIRTKLRHKGILFKIYVAPEYRKKGIAKKMIEMIIDRVTLIPDIEQINLTVIPTNKYAKAIYEGFGFKTYAFEEKAIEWKGKYFNEEQMKLILHE